jgi:hypothetical protein
MMMIAQLARLPKHARGKVDAVDASLIDEAMAAIEVANPGLKGILTKDYNRPVLDR